MTRSHLIILPVLVLLLLASCSTGPDFERDNENDPEGIKFIPNPPSGDSYSIDQLLNVDLHWTDNSDFENGYRVYKILGSDTTRHLLAEIGPNSTSYSDQSKIFAYPTTYEVVSVSNNTESSPIQIPINFGGINSIIYSFANDQIELTWISNTFLNHGYSISRITDNEDKVKFVQNVSADENKAEFGLPQDGFVQEFKVTPFRIYKSDTTWLSPASLTVSETKPSNLNVFPKSLDTLSITWKDNSEFEDSFVLRVLDNEGIHEFLIGPNHTNFFYSKDLKNELEISVQLYAKYKDVSSTLLHNSFNISSIKPPEIDSLITISKNQLKLMWEEPSGIKRSKKLLRSENDGPFIEIGTLGKKDSTYIDSDVDINKYYTYKLDSEFSGESNQIEVFYIPRLSQNKIVKYLGRATHDYVYSKNSNSVIFASGIDELHSSKIYSVNIQSGNISGINSPGEYIEHININEAGDLIAVYDWRGNSDKIYLYTDEPLKLKETITIPNLDYARDIAFLNDDQLIISAQLYNQSTQEHTNNLLLYTISNNSLETLFAAQLSQIHVNYQTNTFQLYKSSYSFEDYEFTISISDYSVDEEGVNQILGRRFKTDIYLQDSRLAISRSPSNDTLIVTSFQEGNGFVKYDYKNDMVLNEAKIISRIAGVYYSDLSNIVVSNLEPSIINTYLNTPRTEIAVKFEEFAGAYYPEDLLLIRDQDILIYPTIVDGSSAINILNISPGWSGK